MALDISSVFGNGFSDVQVNSGGVYLQPGQYKLKVRKVKVDRAQAGFPYFLMEFEVLESSNPGIAEGSFASWMATLKNETHKATFFSNVKGAVLAAVQSSAPETQAEQITEQVIAHVCSDLQPLTGAELRAQASEITTKSGNPFTKVAFFSAA
jgi:hypothetical protein